MFGPALSFDTRVLAEAYDRRPFVFRHQLAEEPLLGRDQIFQLARRCPPAEVLHRVGQVPVNAQLDDAHLKHPTGLALDETLERFDDLKAALTINTPETDPAYRPLAEAVMDEIRAALRPLGEIVTWYATYIFVSTPGTITPYHMDRELNFLLQVHGRKRVRLWNPWDQRVMTTEEVEGLFALWGSIPRPGLHPEAEGLATEDQLTPGLGVHHPFIAPHVVETLDQPSVSWAFTFRTRSTDRITELAKINHRLRRVGLRPGRPGSSALADPIKLAASALGRPVYASLRKLKHALAGGARPD